MAPIYAPTLDVLEREYMVHKSLDAENRDAVLLVIASRVRAAVTTGLVGFSAQLFEALPNLEVVACFGDGGDSIDLDAARRHGVVVSNTPQSIAEPVADLALGLLIAVMRRICECDRFTRAQKWLDGSPPLGTGIGGKRCGIVGLGKVGAAIATRVAALGMKVCYHGPREKRGVPYDYYADLEAMADGCDCLVVTCAETPDTRKLIDSRILAALGTGGYLVNVARGGIVDECALVAALRENKIAGAGLDVFADEPRVPRELLDMDNVVLVPHIGSYTREVREARSATLLANLRAHFAGKPLVTPMT